ncbi:hypothetical protein B0T18DRAFT_418402 [Schizothecium vesticola]|uniref:Uncharacterized protein n=1 Tax=Schizothecium vesticola TaxID=314040 RepID=A0AA40EJS2_9PEZI|nr:hypothetical protein B0T18DRAFT_418402 [Schizothecium vesticola]
MTSPAPTSNPTRPATTAEHDPDFAKFDEYPWARDRAFLQGLTAMLGPLSNSFERQKALGVTLQARIWWYKSKFNVEIDRAAYEDYTSSSSSHNPSAGGIDSALLDKIDDIQRRMGATAPGTAAITSNLPAWMVEAPQKVDLSEKADDGAARQAPGGGSAPYPAHFQVIIEAVTTGKTVPGVRDIPNTVVRQEGILPVGKMQAPPKPWETQRRAAVEDVSIAAGLSGGRNILDQHFPSMGGDDVGGAGEGAAALRTAA